MVMDGHWLTINEYSQYRSISVSTIRRYIKSNKVKFRNCEGKYYLYVSYENMNRKKSDESLLKLDLENAHVKIRKLEEENSEMRMLISAYEERTNEKL